MGAGATLLHHPLAAAPEPQNLSYPLRAIQGTLTPQDLFFVRDHFAEPELSLETWQLRIEGLVARPQQVTFSDLLELPSKQRLRSPVPIECSGNGPHGSAASNGRWEGVPIPFLLERAGITATASAVAFEGADTGRLAEGPSSLPYMQIVPLEKCLDAASLVAYKLNDLFLPRRNGFPARAVFPGWYAMDSVKWLLRMVVLAEADRPAAFFDSGMNRAYTRLIQTPNGVQSQRLSSIQVKSAIAWPGDKMRLPAGIHEVWGFAWTGMGSVWEVAVSANGGSTWEVAKLESAPGPYNWIRWSYRWKAAPGNYLLMSRATDSQGNQQPLERNKDRKDVYELNWCAQLGCSVR